MTWIFVCWAGGLQIESVRRAESDLDVGGWNCQKRLRRRRLLRTMASAAVTSVRYSTVSIDCIDDERNGGYW
jgi:hypothetical protein